VILAVSEVATDVLDKISADEDCATELLDSATTDEDVAAEDSATDESEEEDSTTVDEEVATDDELFSPLTGAAPFSSSPQATIPTATKASTPSNANLFILHLLNCVTNHRFKLAALGLRPQTGNKHRACVIRFLEAAMLVEGEFLVVGNHDNAEIIPVLFVNLVNEDFPDALALVFRTHEQVMHVGVHDAVVHRADHADEFVAIPGGDNGFEVLHRNNEFVWKVSRRPFDGEKKVF